jgi:HlyD family secretion protein
MTRRKWFFIAFASVALAALLTWLLRPVPLPVDTSRVTRGTFVQRVEEDGVIRVRDRYVVASPVAGMMLRPSVRAGDKVARGEVVAIIVPSPAQMLDARTRSELAARIEAASAQASRARSMLRQAEAAAIQADSDHARLAELNAGGYASATELERSGLSLELRRKDVEAARFEADAAAHDLEQARAALREAQPSSDGSRSRASWPVRAPIDGTVLIVRQESEAPVAIGAPIVELGDLSRLEARIDVLSTEASRIPDQAYVELRSGEVSLAGRVRRIEPSAYTKVSALGIEEQRVDVLVDLLPNAVAMRRLADGYRVDAAIEVTREEQALQIPLAALFRHGDQWAAFQVKDGRARRVAVQLGVRGGDTATVLGGLPEGSTVIVYPSDAVHDGARVVPRR